MFFRIIGILSLLSLSLSASATERQYLYGVKYGQEQIEVQKSDPLTLSKALLPDSMSYKGGYNHLLPFVTSSPYQDGAGSCLFMSHTGVVEILMNQKYGKGHDLSERYFMNLKKAHIGDELMKNWRVDTIYRLNATGEIYTNKDYYFGKGYYKTFKGRRVFTHKDDPKASYGTKWNWVIDLDRLSTDQSKRPVNLPKFEREILFEDPEENQWNIGTAPKDIVSRVKKAFAKRKAPIEVIYNHHGFWHANIIVGFNNHADSDGCSFVANFQSRMNKRAGEIREEAQQLPEGKDRDKLMRKARNFERKGKKVNDEFLANGGCRGKGVFYVRDSIYPSEQQAIYDFDRNNEGEEAHLNEPVILRSYEWLERLSNNVVQIYIK